MNWLVVSAIALATGLAAWLASEFVMRSKLHWERSRTADAEGRAAAAEARVDELRRQIADADQDFDTLRSELSASQTHRTAAETKVVELERNVVEQRALLDQAKDKLTETFKSLAADALAANNRGFLTLAEEKFGALREQTKGDLESRKSAIEELLKPLNETLTQYRTESRQILENNQKGLGSVSEQLRSVSETQGTLQRETAKLVNALKSPQVRGRWGEITLRRTAELAGMSDFCDFVEQESVQTEHGRLRPDMIVKLPNGREVVVDSKVPLGGFMDSLESTTEDARKTSLSLHAQQVKQHVDRLSSKEYWSQFPTSPEFVVMFIPSDSFLSVAAEQDRSVIETALSRSVVIATPTTFFALLRAIAFGWRQEVLTQNAQRISQLGQEMSDRLATASEHLAGLGKSIEKSVVTFNSFLSSFETRVLSSARKFKELGAPGKKDIVEVEPVDQVPRSLPREEPSELP
jgi:DNA recombination protein RmuC